MKRDSWLYFYVYRSIYSQGQLVALIKKKKSEATLDSYPLAALRSSAVPSQQVQRYSKKKMYFFLLYLYLSPLSSGLQPLPFQAGAARTPPLFRLGRRSRAVQSLPPYLSGAAASAPQGPYKKMYLFFLRPGARSVAIERRRLVG